MSEDKKPEPVPQEKLEKLQAFWNRRRGFTVVELMIVVAIIGIMAAIAIPKFADLIGKSNCKGSPKKRDCRAWVEMAIKHKRKYQLNWIVDEVPEHAFRAQTALDKIKGRVAKPENVEVDEPAEPRPIRTGVGEPPAESSDQIQIEFTDVIMRLVDGVPRWYATLMLKNGNLLNGCFAKPVAANAMGCVELKYGPGCDDEVVVCK